MPSKMILEKIHSEGLSHISYFLCHKGQAAVVDPRRDVQVYVDMAQSNGATITHIFETHKNEDYIIGSRDLARRTEAEIYHGTGLEWGYGNTVDDGDSFEIGSMRLDILRTPGHTLDSISIALIDTDFGEEPVGVFTGDALFIGDVGRTDFYPDRREEVAGMLYDSIFDKLLPLGDHVLLYPAHGAGSVCGSGMAAREFSSLGYERQNNPALQKTDRDEFVKFKANEQHTMPPYFKKMEEYNQHGSMPEMKELPVPKAVNAQKLIQGRDEMNGQILDIREPEAFAGAFIPGAINIPLDMIPAYAGWLLEYDRPIGLVVSDPSQVETAVRYLIRMGYDDIRGYLPGGLHQWETAGQKFNSIYTMTASQLKEQLQQGRDLLILDVRKPEVFESAHLEKAKNIFLGHLPDHLDELPRDKPIVTFCGSGRRASIAASILAANGFGYIFNNLGSMKACMEVGCKSVMKGEKIGSA
ncbi:MAG: MBL fold metallo-hydrolase [Phycisphaerae bacterium]